MSLIETKEHLVEVLETMDENEGKEPLDYSDNETILKSYEARKAYLDDAYEGEFDTLIKVLKA